MNSEESEYPEVWYICKYCYRAFTNNNDMVCHKESQHLDRIERKRKIVTSESGAAAEVEQEAGSLSSLGRGKRAKRGVETERGVSSPVKSMNQSVPAISTKGKTNGKKKLAAVTTVDSDLGQLEVVGLSNSGRGKP